VIRRVLRIFANVMAALSLLLCMAVGYLWVRSYWKTDGWERTPYFAQINVYRQDRIQTSRGQFLLDLRGFKIDDGFVQRMRKATEKGDYPDRWERARLVTHWRPRTEHWWEKVGLYVRWQTNFQLGSVPGAGVFWFVVVPYWVLVLVTMAWPVVWSVRWWRRRRWRPGLCRDCGYDLRASPQRCPECGAVAATGAEVTN
jgi:hypothetical protein